MIDRKAFFDGYRAAFGRLQHEQVAGLETLLWAIEHDTQDDLRWFAYMLATVKHECADTWHPIVEKGPRPYFDKYEPGTGVAKRLGNTEPGDGYRFRGRGYVQITGRANYKRLTDVLHCPNLETDPDRALSPSLAYLILSTGMRDGLFTGVKLSDCIPLDSYANYLSARRIVNGMDQASRIAGFAKSFETILEGATHGTN